MNLSINLRTLWVSLAILSFILPLGCSDDTDSGNPTEDAGYIEDMGSGDSGDTGAGDMNGPDLNEPDMYADMLTDMLTDMNSDAGDSGGNIDGPQRLISAATLTSTTIELRFSQPVTGTNKGFSLNGTRSSGFESVTGFGTTDLVGTIDEPVVYGEVVTVSYDDEVGDIVDLPWYRREFVVNDQAFSGPEVWVAADATGSGDGSQASPFNITQMNTASNISVGMRINIEKGVYTQRVNVVRSGVPGQPIIYEGYENNAGDINYDVFHATYPTPIDGTRLPLLDGGNRDTVGSAGVTINNKRFVTFKNVQIKDYRVGFTSGFSNPSDNLTFDNCATEDIGNTKGSSQGSGYNLTYSSTFVNPFNITVVNSYARNSAMANYAIAGPDAFVFNTSSYSDQDVYPGTGDLYWSTDYHIGMKNSDDAVVRGCHAENVGDLMHTAHGISVRSDYGSTAHRVLIEDSDIVNINGSIELRHDEVKYALVRNVRIRGGNSRYAGGIHFRDGTSFNTIDASRISGITKGSNGAISYYDSVEEGRGQDMEGNVIKNTVFEDVNLLVRLSSGSEPNFDLIDHGFFNCTVHDVDTAYRRYDNLTVTNFTGVNNIFSDVATQNYGGADSGIVETYSNYFGGFAMPAGEGNMSVDPMFADQAAGDFHLSTDSPVQDSGTDLDEVTHDFDGQPRATGSYSMGAFE